MVNMAGCRIGIRKWPLRDSTKAKISIKTLSFVKEIKVWSHFELVLSEKRHDFVRELTGGFCCVYLFPRVFETFRSERCKMSLTIQR